MFVRKKTIDELKTKILSLEEGLHKQWLITSEQQEVIEFLSQHSKDDVEICYHYEKSIFLPKPKMVFLHKGKLKNVIFDFKMTLPFKLVENGEESFVVRRGSNRYYKVDKESEKYVEVTEFYKTDEKVNAHPTEKSDETT